MGPLVDLRARFLLACAVALTPALRTQSMNLGSPGAGHSLLRGPSISISICKALDGSGLSRFVIDGGAPGTSHASDPIQGGLRFRFSSKLSSAGLGSFQLGTELDLLGPGPGGSWDLLARVTRLDPALQVASIGVEFEFPDLPGEQALLMPAFGGVEFVEPATTIPGNQPIDLGAAVSVQATCYYADDGTGLYMFAVDPAGTEPKHCLYHSDAGRRSIRIAFEFYPRIHPVGGDPAHTPVPIRTGFYTFDPTTEKGWFKTAKLYRAWLEAHARGAGALLSRGRLEQRPDIPIWMKELDLLVSERWGWYPQASKVPVPLLALRRLDADLGARNILVALWFSGDLESDLGRTGSNVPNAGTSQQAQLLLGDGIRVIGYVNPGAFDLANPLLYAANLWPHAVEDRQGQPIVGGANNDLLIMDVAAPELAEWYHLLGAYHATSSGFSGFYCDAPATVGMPDWRRPAGQPVGVSVEAYEGYCKILTRAREGAEVFEREFVTLHESAFEWLVPCSSGQGAVGVIQRTYPDSENTRGVPFFQAVYSGYALFWPADEGFGTQTLLTLHEAYGDLAESNMTRLLAEGFTWGAILNSSELALPDGKLFYEADVPEPVKSSFLHHKNTLRDLIEVRRLARPWLVYGEMLNSPLVSGDMVDVHISLLFDSQFRLQTFKKLAAPVSAWRAADGSLMLVAANGGRQAATVRVDLARCGLAGDWNLRDLRTNRLFLLDPTTHTIELVVDPASGMLLEPER